MKKRTVDCLCTIGAVTAGCSLLGTDLMSAHALPVLGSSTNVAQRDLQHEVVVHRTFDGHMQFMYACLERLTWTMECLTQRCEVAGASNSPTGTTLVSYLTDI
jgi:hypothetical protein